MNFINDKSVGNSAYSNIDEAEAALAARITRLKIQKDPNDVVKAKREVAEAVALEARCRVYRKQLEVIRASTAKQEAELRRQTIENDKKLKMADEEWVKVDGLEEWEVVDGA